MERGFGSSRINDKLYRLIKKKDYNKYWMERKILNLSDNEDDYTNNLIKEKNLNNLSFSTNGIGSKIKIYKCVVWKNNDPNINEDILQTILHYRNRSQGLNKSFIMKLPKDINFDKLTNNNIGQVSTEEKNIFNDNSYKNNSNNKFLIKNSKSYVNLYKKSYYKK